MRSGLVGCCEPFDSPGGQYVQWDDDKWAYIVNRERWNSLCRALLKQHMGMYRQSQRAEICATMAGPVADCMFLGEEVEGFVQGNCTEQWHDEAVADAMSWLLPYRNEFEHLTQMSHEVLRRPGVWSAVENLAEALYLAGDMECEALAPYLPSPLKNWPPSPRKGAS